MLNLKVSTPDNLAQFTTVNPRATHSPIMTYTPKVNDYVIWERHGLRDEGWVYFVSTPTENKKGFTETQQYLTIETGIRRKPECQYEKNNPHQYVHILLCCYVYQWSELRYVKRRKGQKDSTILPESNQHIYYSEPKQNTHTGQ